PGKHRLESSWPVGLGGTCHLNHVRPTPPRILSSMAHSMRETRTIPSDQGIGKNQLSFGAKLKLNNREPALMPLAPMSKSAHFYVCVPVRILACISFNIGRHFWQLPRLRKSLNLTPKRF